jgi:hypothetical protein
VTTEEAGFAFAGTNTFPSFREAVLSKALFDVTEIERVAFG